MSDEGTGEYSAIKMLVSEFGECRGNLVPDVGSGILKGLRRLGMEEEGMCVQKDALYRGRGVVWKGLKCRVIRVFDVRKVSNESGYLRGLLAYPFCTCIQVSPEWISGVVI